MRLILFLVFIQVGCVNNLNKNSTYKEMNPILNIISDIEISKEKLIEALASLKDTSESYKFWLMIVNNNAYKDDHRRRALFMLFNRHIKANITIQDFSRFLEKPNWLAIDDIEVVSLLGGEMPIGFNPNDTNLVLKVFPNISDSQRKFWAIYIRIEGKISKTEFFEIVSSGGERGSKELKEKKILEIGLSPDNPFDDLL